MQSGGTIDDGMQAIEDGLNWMMSTVWRGVRGAANEFVAAAIDDGTVELEGVTVDSRNSTSNSLGNTPRRFAIERTETLLDSISNDYDALRREKTTVVIRFLENALLRLKDYEDWLYDEELGVYSVYVIEGEEALDTDRDAITDAIIDYKEILRAKLQLQALEQETLRKENDAEEGLLDLTLLFQEEEVSAPTQLSRDNSVSSVVAAASDNPAEGLQEVSSTEEDDREEAVSAVSVEPIDSDEDKVKALAMMIFYYQLRAQQWMQMMRSDFMATIKHLSSKDQLQQAKAHAAAISSDYYSRTREALTLTDEYFREGLDKPVTEDALSAWLAKRAATPASLTSFSAVTSVSTAPAVVVATEDYCPPSP